MSVHRIVDNGNLGHLVSFWLINNGSFYVLATVHYSWKCYEKTVKLLGRADGFRFSSASSSSFSVVDKKPAS